ncbi:NUDIX domain-containing protein [Desulfovibrio inopinatus]|uniref:NUDIX domain-containing protein n=1 Tax=Desulfovibrio inopinatus TaxID=102109 RepID=UPI0004234140
MLKKPCPKCGEEIVYYRNPVPTVDIIIHIPGQGVVLIERQNEPYGWAIPGGFIDYGEQAEVAAIREAKEETGLDVVLTDLLGVFSKPDRDPRQHTLSVVYVAVPVDAQALTAGDDAKAAKVFDLEHLPEPLVFDHAHILHRYAQKRKSLAV